MSIAAGKGYRTFAITGQKVQLSSGSVPNLSSIFYNDNDTSRTMVQQKNKANQGSFYQTPDDIRKAVQKYMSASASDITRLNDSQITNLSLQQRTTSSNGGFNSRGSSRANSPAPSRHLEVSIRVSTPDETNGKMPPTGRGRPNAPNISMIRGPKFSVFYFNDDFTFDEDTSQAQIAENMLNDLTISSTLDKTGNSLYTDADDKTPMNSSNSDGGYVSSELSDNTIHDSPKIDVKGIQDAQQEFSDPNNNTKIKDNVENLNEKKTEVETNNSYGVDLYLTQSDLASKSQQESENNARQYDDLQRTVSKMSDDVFSETSADETMRFSELKLSEASSMASTLHNDDLESNISYDIRINDTMGIPMVSTLKRQDAPSKEINLSVLNDNTITQEDGLLTVTGNKEASQRSSNKPDIPDNKNWTQERSSSFSGFTQLQRLKENSNRSYRDLNRIRGEHSYVKRNDSFVKSIENVSPWKGSWTARNVTFDETANQKFRIESRQERKEQLERDAAIDQQLSIQNQNKIHHHHAQQKYKQTRPQNHYGSLDVRRHNRNQQHEAKPLQMRTSMPQQSNLARHLNNTSVPSGKVSSQAWKRYSSPPSLEPHFSAYNRAQEEKDVIQMTQPSNHEQAIQSQNQNAVNNSRSDIPNVHNYGAAVPKDYKYPTLPRNFGGQKAHQHNQRNVQQRDRDDFKAAHLKELIDQRSAPNQNERIIRQYYNQFYDQNYNKPPSPGRNNSRQKPQQYSSNTQNFPQTYGQNPHIVQRERIPVQRNTSSNSMRSNSFLSYSNSASSSPVRIAVSPNRFYTTTIVPVPETSKYNSKNKSARRKLLLSDSDGDDEGGFKQHETKRQARRDEQKVKRMNDGEIEEERVPRHPAVQTIQEPHRWVGR